MRKVRHGICRVSSKAGPMLFHFIPGRHPKSDQEQLHGLDAKARFLDYDELSISNGRMVSGSSVHKLVLVSHSDIGKAKTD